MSTLAILETLNAKRTPLGIAVPQTFRAALTVESIIQAVGLACERNERLAKSDPMTVYTAVLDIVRIGLDLSPMLQQAFLVPFWNKDRSCFECSAMIGQQGKIELAFRTGKYASIVTEVVHRHDDYEFDLARRHLRHSFNPDLADRGPGVFGYARAWLVGFDLDGPPNFQEIMTAHDFGKIESASRKRNKGKLSPAYAEWRNEMWRRSALARMLKRAPKSVDLAEVLNREAELAVRQRSGDVIDSTWADDADEPKAIAEDVGNPTEGTPKKEKIPARADAASGSNDSSGGMP